MDLLACGAVATGPEVAREAIALLPPPGTAAAAEGRCRVCRAEAMLQPQHPPTYPAPPATPVSQFELPII